MGKLFKNQGFVLSAVLSSMLLITGCGGDDNDSSNSPAEEQKQKETLSGTAATGAALADATIEVVNKNGQTATTTTDQNGKFTIQIDTGAPYMIKASKGETVLYSYAAGAGYVNVTQLTTQSILAANKAAEDRDFDSLADVYANWKQIAAETTIDEFNEILEEASKEAIANLKTVFEANGFNSTTGYPDLFEYEFDANSTGFDAILDSVVITGLNSACTGIGSTYSCDVSYRVNGADFTWNYDISTDGINTVIDIDTGNNPTIPSGDYNLKVTTSVMGSSTSVTINNVPKPANESEFCGSDEMNAQLPEGSVKINSCSFNGTVGNIDATVTANGFSVSYSVKYEYSAA